MKYNPDLQYRCTIIRGKAKTELDNLLPAYADIIDSVCPCKEETFNEQFNKMLAKYLSSPTEKTLNNHRTEIAGKLFGMWNMDQDGLIKISPRALRLLDSRDNPAFFKELIMKFQFPNGMDKLHTIKDRLKHRINIRPCSYVLKVLSVTAQKKFSLSKNEIAYYVLNNLTVLQGGVDPEDVINVILTRRKKRIYKKVETPGKASSYSMQHITELLNFIELANLIKINRSGHTKYIKLNNREMDVIEYISSFYDTPPMFDMYKYNINEPGIGKRIRREWDIYYSKIIREKEIFKTTISKLIDEEVPAAVGVDTAEIGEEGEMIAFNYEKNRVKAFSERLANKVIYFGKQRGLGYDISSIKADSTDKSEHAVFIEVKSTKRVTAPKKEFKDQFCMTRNEWVAAEQYKDNFFVYRVYITNKGIKIFKIQNLCEKNMSENLLAVPLKYNVEFNNKAGEFIL